MPVSLAIAASAWALLWWWSLRTGGHEHGSTGASSSEIERVGLVLLWWMLMVAAMMLPLAADLLGAIAGLLRSEGRASPIVVLSGLAFAGTWIAAGATLLLADRGAGVAVEQVAWLGDHPGAAAGVLLVAVGLYQFTPSKRRGLIACRSSSEFVARRWNQGRPAGSALRVGGSYGTACVGSCGALMAVMFAAASVGILLMTTLAAVIAIERVTPWGLGFARAAGATIVTLGLVLLSSAAM